jgi:hypothetical protein
MIAPKLKDLTLPFTEADLEWRVQRSGMAHGRPWALALAYVDARAVQNRLDEVVGPENWTVQYHHIPGGVMCDLSIRCNDGEWVTKSDGSPETNIEAFKGGISKSLVRAASVWGIGRYLYRLQDNFANFVDKRTAGARELRIDGQYFYWVPPELPEWALPEEARGGKNRQAQKPAAKSVVLPEGAQSAAHELESASRENRERSSGGGEEPVSVSLLSQYFKPEDDNFTGGYVVNFGRKHFGKRIADIPVDEIEKYRNWLVDDSKKSGKPLSEKAQEFIAATEAYLNNFRSERTNEPKEAEDIPF